MFDAELEPGDWLVYGRGEMDRAEALWLDRLAEFDRDQLWALDGQLSCAAWLVWRLNMSRSTAFEKLRVAHELQRRPIVADAFRQGQLSYSAARAITRIDRPDPEVDQALVQLAQSGQASIVDLERVVRSYQLYADQERPPTDDARRSRDVKILRSDQGTGRIEITLDELELEQFAATLQAFLDLEYRPVDKSSAEDSDLPTEAPLEEATRAAKRVDAFMHMVTTGLAHADQCRAGGDDRYMVHLVRYADSAALLTVDGRALHPSLAGTVECDAARVTHAIGNKGEPLHLGRKTRDWSSAQRRAVSIRDGGHCRFVGCHHAHVDIHHLRPWEDGGQTDIDNAVSQCPRHHHMLHAGYRTAGDPHGELRFFRPDGSYLGSTFPAHARRLAGV